MLNKTAKVLGLEISTLILLSANELIKQDYRNARRLVADGGNGSVGIDLPSGMLDHVRHASK